LKDFGFIIPDVPDYATNNAHIFYMICPSLDVRSRFISYLKEHGIQATFHYLPLHSSEYYKDKHDGRELSNCDKYADCLVRLPLYYELRDEEIDYIINTVKTFATAL
jgi:dTDP-4-amino-4,6-dideoxygalactose transaminase